MAAYVLKGFAMMLVDRQMASYKVVLIAVLSFVIAAMVSYFIQVLPVSLRRLLIDSTVLTGAELWILEVIVGFVNSLIVTAICLAILRRPVGPVTVAALISQIAWIEWAYFFRQGGGTLVETLLRYSEHLGVVLGAIAAAFLFIRLSSRTKPTHAS